MNNNCIYIYIYTKILCIVHVSEIEGLSTVRISVAFFVRGGSYDYTDWHSNATLVGRWRNVGVSDWLRESARYGQLVHSFWHSLKVERYVILQ